MLKKANREKQPGLFGKRITSKCTTHSAQKFVTPRPRDLLRLYNSLKKEIGEIFTYAFYKFMATENGTDCNITKFRILTCEQFRTFFCREERGLVKAIGWIVGLTMSFRIPGAPFCFDGVAVMHHNNAYYVQKVKINSR